MQFNSLTPNLAVHDIRETVRFYQEKLGFNLLMAVPVSQDGIDQEFLDGKEYVYAMVGKDKTALMFQREDTFFEDVTLAEKSDVGASVSFYFEIENLDDYYQDLLNKCVKPTVIKTTWYGQREFYIKDNNGYVLCFAQQGA